MRLVVLVGSWILFVSTTAHSTTWHITPEGSGDAPTIQSAIDSAAPGDTVELSCGVYTWGDQGTGTDDGLVSLKSGIYLTGPPEGPGCATLDAEQQGRVLYCNGVDATAEVVGLILTGGYVSIYPNRDGGGLLCSSSSPMVRECSFVENYAVSGGGAFCFDGSSPTFEQCTFESNQAPGGYGGGVCCVGGSTPSFSDCEFSNNVAYGGGGIYSGPKSPPSVVECRFLGNSVSDAGGGLLGAGTTPTLIGCLFSGNVANFGGAGLYLYSSSAATVERCTFAGNLAFGPGGAIAVQDASATLSRVLIWGNCAEGSPGQEAYLWDGSSALSFSCCDVDTSGNGIEGPGQATWTGTNHFSDPLFCDPESCWNAPTAFGDYHLQWGSPCLAAHSAGCEQIGANGPGNCSSTRVEPTTWARTKARYK